MKENELKVLRHIRNNARVKLSCISRAENIPETTVFDLLKKMEKTIIKRFAMVIKPESVGYPIRLYAAVNANTSDKQKELIEILLCNRHVNNLYLAEHNTLLVDAVFRDVAQADSFLCTLKSAEAGDSEYVFITEELKTEKFCPE